MKTLVKIILIVLIILAIPLILALFIKNEYAVEREITINKPKQEVFEYVKILKNQDNFSKWVMMDPEMKKDFRGNDGTVGFIYSWEGEKSGKGEQEIKNITEGEAVDLSLHFIKPFEGFATAQFATQAVSDTQTKVKWGMQGESKYPFNFMNLFMDNMLGSDLETSLANLKGVLERNK